MKKVLCVVTPVMVDGSEPPIAVDHVYTVFDEQAIRMDDDFYINLYRLVEVRGVYDQTLFTDLAEVKPTAADLIEFQLNQRK